MQVAESTLETLKWDNRSLRSLPVLPASEAGSLTEPRSKVSGACFSPAEPTPVERPTLVVASDSALRLLGLDPAEAVRRADEFAAYFAGNQLLPGAEPAAHCYCGHQFGNFSGQLGDGATMYLGEVINPAGERWEVQFKGAGRTHYSRSADGRKVLRSSLREMLASEAAHALGVPTTRAGTLVTSDTRVARDIHYDGRVTYERASVVLRIAPSFLRFGSFEVCKPRDAVTGMQGPSVGDHALLERLLNHVASLLVPLPAASTAGAESDAPGVPRTQSGSSSLGCSVGGSGNASIDSTSSTTAALQASLAIAESSAAVAGARQASEQSPPPSSGGDGGASVSPATLSDEERQRWWLSAFGEIVARTARLVARWQCVGFCHGVLNTDNMSVLGLSIDYGPFGYLDTYDPSFACNGSDTSGRYSYAEQPEVCLWNCERLADALAPLVPRTLFQTLLDGYKPAYEAAYLEGMRAKLGLRTSSPSDAMLITALFETMETSGADFTTTFRALCAIDPPSGDAGLASLVETITARCATPARLAETMEARAQAVRGGVPIPLPQLMQLLQVAQANPAALAMLGEPAQVHAELMGALAKVQKAQELADAANALRAESPATRRHACAESWRVWLSGYRARLAEEDEAAARHTEGTPEAFAAARREAMRWVNPRVVLRNWIAQEAIDAAEAGNYAHVRTILEVITHPYEEGADSYAEPPSLALASLCVT